MPYSYPVELRDKAVKAYLNEKGTQKEITSICGMGLSSLTRYLRQYEQSGELAAKPHPGSPPILREGDFQRIKHWVEETPDIELKELCTLVERELGKVVSDRRSAYTGKILGSRQIMRLLSTICDPMVYRPWY